MAKKTREAKLSPEDEDSMMGAIGEGSDSKKPAEEDAPSYRVIGESKIPVSKVRGKMWRSRRDTAAKLMQEIFDAWDEALSYYHATQDAHRRDNGDAETSGAQVVRQRRNRILSEQENIVFANAAALVPSLYAKNPEITTTGTVEALKAFYECVEQLGNVIIARKTWPGVSLKGKVRKAIVSAALTNEGWMEIGWTFKDESSEQVMLDLQKLSDEFAKTKDSKRLKEIEGELQALEYKTDVLTPSGPWAKYREPKQVLIDPNANEDDGSDAAWQMVYEMVPTNSLNALYGKKDGNGNWVSVYDPTHRLQSNDNGGNSVDEQVKNFRLFTGDDKNDKNRDKSLDITKVWYVFDKTTRRIELYHDTNWSWPIWVWEDRLKLDRFFPLYRLPFHTSPCNTRMKGEVSYYLDQQDSINEINDAEARARDMVKYTGFFDKNLGIDDKTIKEVINGPDGTMKGVNVPEGKKLDDLFVTLTPEYLKFPQLFDDAAKQRKLQAIDRISSVSDVLRGGQFKTNTTNKAIDTYNSISNTRLDDRIDAIEDFIGDITWGIIQLCLMNMDQSTVAILVGPTRAANWKNMEPEEIITNFASCRVEGGSTSKPTTKAKKEEALELMQVLGQFVQAAPGPVTKVMFRVGERAFDEFVMNDLDWQELDAAIQFSLQEQAGQPAQPGAEQQQAPNVEQILQQLPPEAQQAVANAIQQGVPPEQAIAKVQEMMNQTPQGVA